MPTATRPDALLLITSSCPHCPSVLQGLSDLVKQGVIGRLEVVNIGFHPEVAQKHGVRSVPWIRIGEFDLEGRYLMAELRQWAERAGTPTGLAEYFHEQLKNGALARVSERAAREPAAVDALLRLLGDSDTELTVRIGINAVFESLEGQPGIARAVEPLLALTRHRDAHVRGDAAHLLSLTADARARARLQEMLTDEVADVSEIAREGLERLPSA
jgi:Thioredoxin domain